MTSFVNNRIDAPKQLPLKRVAEIEKRLNRKLTPTELFDFGLDHRHDLRSTAQKVMDEKWKPVVREMTYDDVLLGQVNEAQAAADAARVKEMPPAEKRLWASKKAYADLQREKQVAAEMKAHLDKYKPLLTKLKKAHDLAKYDPAYDAGGLFEIEKAILQIEVGPNADPEAIMAYYANAMAIPRRLAEKQTAEINERMVALNAAKSEIELQLLELDPTTAQAEAEEAAPPAEFKYTPPKSQAAWKKYFALSQAARTDDSKKAERDAAWKEYSAATAAEEADAAAAESAQAAEA